MSKPEKVRILAEENQEKPGGSTTTAGYISLTDIPTSQGHRQIASSDRKACKPTRLSHITRATK